MIDEARMPVILRIMILWSQYMIAIVIEMLSMLLFVRVLSFKIVYMFLQCQCGQIVDRRIRCQARCAIYVRNIYK